MTESTRFEPAPDVLLTDLSESESCLLNTRTRYYYALNETGRLIWKEVTDHGTPDTVVRVLRELYEIDEAGARDHVQAFLQKLLDDGLITPRGSD